MPFSCILRKTNKENPTNNNNNPDLAKVNTPGRIQNFAKKKKRKDNVGGHVGGVASARDVR